MGKYRILDKILWGLKDDMLSAKLGIRRTKKKRGNDV